MQLKIAKGFMVMLVFGIAFSACQKSEKPVPVPPLKDYRDGSNLFTIHLPDGWPISTQPGKVWVYNSNDAANKFFDPTTGKPGVKIYAYAENAGAKKLDDYVQSFKDELRQEQAQIDPDVQTTLAGSPAIKIPYSLKVDSKNTIYSYRVMTVVDSMLYGYEVAGFNDFYKIYKNVFDSVESTYHIVPKAVQQAQLPENLIPSTTLATYQNDYYLIQYPDNFTAQTKKASGDILASEYIQGYRADCTIQIDVLDAKHLNVDKVFEQNKGKYPNISHTEKIKIDGLDAYRIDYSPVRDILSRAYFVVKNNKVVRVTLNWYKPMQNDYLPAFEKTVASLKLK